MEASEYRNIFENEGSHFFYVANRKVILSLVKKYAGKDKKIRILDAGCGTGFLAKKLEPYGDVDAIDLHSEAVKFAKLRGINAKKASVNDIPFRENSFDLAVSIDVIYHKQVDDQKALKELFRVLKSGGFLILRVPAVKWLSLAHDRHVHTRERYSMAELKLKLLSAGFKIEKISFANMILLPAAILQHFWERLNPPSKTLSGITKLPRIASTLLIYLLSLEGHLLPRMNLPFGLGLMAVCRKP